MTEQEPYNPRYTVIHGETAEGRRIEVIHSIRGYADLAYAIARAIGAGCEMQDVKITVLGAAPSESDLVLAEGDGTPKVPLDIIFMVAWAEPQAIVASDPQEEHETGGRSNTPVQSN